MVLGVDMTAKAALMTALAMERTFVCRDGLKLAAQCYPPSPAQAPRHKVLLLHGWLDNSQTFWKLAPRLKNDDVVALDLPGHGRSDHKGKDTPPLALAESAYYVADVLEQLEWTSGVTLIGHSMGAAISLIYSASFPEQIERLVLLEGAGPLAKEPKDVSKHIRAHVDKRLKGNQSLYHSKGTKGPRIYLSLEKAAETRQNTAKLFPGKQYISIEAARELVDRAMSKDPAGNGLIFQHDVRLQWPSLLYMSPAEVEALQEAVQCPTYLLLAEDGWPFDADRLESTKDRLQPKQFDILPGSHHFHADPDTADAVLDHINEFLNIND